MRQSATELATFYATPLGQAAGRLMSRKIAEAWGDCAGLDILALGYAAPLLEHLRNPDARVVRATPADQGVVDVAERPDRLRCVVNEVALPLANARFDRILVAHVLEETGNPLAVLTEIHRVLGPAGRAILVATARHGLWAGAESTPFGQGRSFSRGQLERLTSEADLKPCGWTRALYLPPLALAARWADPIEHLGARLWPPFAGVLLLEVTKQVVALRPAGLLAGRRTRARPAFQPAPIGGKVRAQLESKEMCR